MGGRRLVEHREVGMGLRVVPVGQGWALWGWRWGAGPAAGPPGQEEEGRKGAGMNPEPLGWGLGGGGEENAEHFWSCFGANSRWVINNWM